MKKIFTLMMTAVFSVVMFAATETTVYYTAPASEIGSYTVKLNVNFKGDGDEWHQYNMTLTNMSYNNDPVYTYTYTDMYDGVGVMQFQLYDGDNWKSQKQAISTWTFATEYNGKMYVHATEQWVAAPGEGDEPGPGPQPSTGAHDYYLKGYRGPTSGNIETPTIEEQFEGGILADYAFEGDSKGLGYFFVLVCDEGAVIGKEYMAKDYSDATHCTLYSKDDTGYVEKLGVPAPSATFYLYDNGDGTLELSIEPLPGKTLVGGGEQAIENTIVTEKARKQIIDGQLRIIRGDKMYDATGKAL